MSAVLQAREPDAKYLVTRQSPLAQHFDLLATAPGGVARLRELILTLAVQGKLVAQDAREEPASVLVEKMRAEKIGLIAAATIKRDRPQPDISEEEMPFDLPRGWEWMRLSDATYNHGQGAPAEQFTYIDVAAIDNALPSLLTCKF
ncbi:MAG: hypothetical protein EOO29_05380 [Comamonadaceae bacterium]|nr:MAG: hypothetical protein EOO29_05380 [Comamonadaceae bacterium]